MATVARILHEATQPNGVGGRVLAVVAFLMVTGLALSFV